MEVAYLLRCPDPRLLLDLPDDVFDAWIWFLNERAEQEQAHADQALQSIPNGLDLLGS